MIELIELIYADDIKTALIKDEIFKGIFSTQELSPDWEPNTDFITWFGVLKDNKPFGIIVIQPTQEDIWCFHGGIYLDQRGPDSPDILRECLDQLWEPGIAFMTTVNVNNHPANHLVKKAGFIHTMTINNTNFYKDTEV